MLFGMINTKTSEKDAEYISFLTLKYLSRPVN